MENPRTTIFCGPFDFRRLCGRSMKSTGSGVSIQYREFTDTILNLLSLVKNLFSEIVILNEVVAFN